MKIDAMGPAYVRRQVHPRLSPGCRMIGVQLPRPARVGDESNSVGLGVPAGTTLTAANYPDVVGIGQLAHREHHLEGDQAVGELGHAHRRAAQHGDDRFQGDAGPVMEARPIERIGVTPDQLLGAALHHPDHISVVAPAAQPALPRRRLTSGPGRNRCCPSKSALVDTVPMTTNAMPATGGSSDGSDRRPKRRRSYPPARPRRQ
ncbi:MAG: hypothetical protein PHQ28_04085 [Mycobacterium sp.]|nr:hypothetical protein [Mycobacterium sp.]